MYLALSMEHPQLAPVSKMIGEMATLAIPVEGAEAAAGVGIDLGQLGLKNAAEYFPKLAPAISKNI